jgi:hypothetical protein
MLGSVFLGFLSYFKVLLVSVIDKYAVIDKQNYEVYQTSL